jgi:hypothetical protein
MAASQKNILVGAARLWTSFGTGSNRPGLTGTNVFPWTVNVSGANQSNSTVAAASATSTPAFLNSTASSYWREVGFTSTGVDISYEPGYSDVVVDQLLDAARLFQQSLKIVIKTELDEGTFENMNFVWGQQETLLNVGQTAASVAAIQQYGLGTASAIQQLNINGGSLGIAPVERTLVFVGNAPGLMGAVAGSAQTPYPTTSSSVASPFTATTTNGADVSGVRSKERVYVARRIVQEQTTAHALKRDAATVFPVSFRALPDVDRTEAGGSEYGFIIDRVYGTS